MALAESAEHLEEQVYTLHESLVKATLKDIIRHKKFIPIGQVNEVLSYAAIRKLFECRLHLSPIQRDGDIERAVKRVLGTSHPKAQRRFLKVFAVLIYGNDAENVAKTVDYLLGVDHGDATSFVPPADEDLPLDKKHAFDTFGRRDGTWFYKEQYTFCAFVMNEGKRNEPDPLCPLPFIFQSTKPLDSGSAGHVYKVGVARDYWCHEHESLKGQWYSREEVIYLARKDFRTRAAFTKESTILENLRQAPMRCRNIMLPIASLVAEVPTPSLEIESIQSLLYPLAEKNLNDFLQDVPAIDPSIWDWSKRVRVIENATGLVGALRWLHQYEEGHALYHFDIRPQNILVFGTGEEERFMLADFDLAHDKSFSDKDKEHSSVSIRQGPSAYRAPEVASGKAGHQSDVWSMACMIVLIVSYIYKGPAAMGEFTERRGKFPDNKDRGNDFFHETARDGETEGMFYGVNPQVLSWFEDLKIFAHKVSSHDLAYVERLAQFLTKHVFVHKGQKEDQQINGTVADSHNSGQQKGQQRRATAAELHHFMAKELAFYCRSHKDEKKDEKENEDGDEDEDPVIPIPTIPSTSLRLDTNSHSPSPVMAAMDPPTRSDTSQKVQATSRPPSTNRLSAPYPHRIVMVATSRPSTPPDSPVHRPVEDSPTNSYGNQHDPALAFPEPKSDMPSVRISQGNETELISEISSAPGTHPNPANSELAGAHPLPTSPNNELAEDSPPPQTETTVQSCTEYCRAFRNGEIFSLDRLHESPAWRSSINNKCPKCGNAPLHFAVAGDYTEEISRLLAIKDIDVGLRLSTGVTPVMKSFEKRNIEAFTKLLAQGPQFFDMKKYLGVRSKLDPKFRKGIEPLVKRLPGYKRSWL